MPFKNTFQDNGCVTLAGIKVDLMAGSTFMGPQSIAFERELFAI